MCFVNEDYDWVAEVCETDTVTLTEPKRCCECRRRLRVGESVLRTFMQEREPGEYCDPSTGYHCVDYCFGDGEDPTNFDQCERVGPGETFEGYTCTECQTLLDAIEAVELDVGCTAYHARPTVGMMHQEVNDGEGWQHYAAEFLRLGLRDAWLLAPDIDQEDHWDAIAEEYPNSYCWTEREPADRFDIGGEG